MDPEKKLEVYKKEYELIEKEIERVNKKYQNIVWTVLPIIISIYGACLTDNQVYNNLLRKLAILIPPIMLLVVMVVYVGNAITEKKLLKSKEILEKRIFGEKIYIKRKQTCKCNIIINNRYIRSYNFYTDFKQQ